MSALRFSMSQADRAICADMGFYKPKGFSERRKRGNGIWKLLMVALGGTTTSLWK